MGKTAKQLAEELKALRRKRIKQQGIANLKAKIAAERKATAQQSGFFKFGQKVEKGGKALFKGAKGLASHIEVSDKPRKAKKNQYFRENPFNF